MVSSLRIPDVLRARIDAAAGEGKRSEWILEACRMRLDGEGPHRLARDGNQSGARFDSAAVPPKPDKQALRAICASKLKSEIDRTGNNLGAGYLPDEPIFNPSIKMCTYREWDGDTGRTMACGLPEHSSKQRHGNWRVLDA
jgi:hypothetical protein